MRADLIKTNLRNIALITDCFRDKVSEEDKEEVRRIETFKKNHFGIDAYERRFLNEVNKIKLSFLRQIKHLADQIIKELAKPSDELSIDKQKAAIARKHLTQADTKLLLTLYDLETERRDLLLDNDDDDLFPYQVRKLSHHIDKLVTASTNCLDKE